MQKKQKDQFSYLYTEAGAKLAADRETIPWTEYPRPQLKRDSYICLNGWWEFAVAQTGDAPDYQKQIRVPFVPESSLSGIGRAMSSGVRLCYRRRFSSPSHKANERVLLHIGAADQIAEAWVNGVQMGCHCGGYGAFSFDITDVLRGENELEIFVTNASEPYLLPYGKQRKKRGGMWYTPVSGIWQTVWMECVPRDHIQALQITTDTSGADITAVMASGTRCDGTVTLHDANGDCTVVLKDGHARINVENPVLWSPDTPHLYSITVCVGEDRVGSYFALRTLEIKVIDGIPRLCLNGKPYFFHGLLDQGYYSDGVFLPAVPEEYERDIMAAKQCGYNMLRKHIKVEPALFYHACDRLGMIVFQDMVNNGKYSFLRDTALPTVGLKHRNDKLMHRNKAQRKAFLDGMTETVTQLGHFSCICAWTIFNEGWGQFDHATAYQALKGLDATRFIDSVSGWFLPRRAETLQSDVESVHVYFKPVQIKKRTDKPLVLSEFGGYSYKVEEHSFNLVGNYGYKSFSDSASFENALEELYRFEILPAVRAGLCAAVYTQLSDVEDETNGLLTYDRRVCKVSPERMRTMANALRDAMENREK